jgi:hypothetical protein
MPRQPTQVLTRVPKPALTQVETQAADSGALETWVAQTLAGTSGSRSHKHDPETRGGWRTRRPPFAMMEQ